MNEIEIPKLNSRQYSVIQAETKSGIILTLEEKYYLNNSKDDYYLIFDSFENAKIFCETKVKKHQTIECCIYSHLAEIVEVIRFQ